MPRSPSESRPLFRQEAIDAQREKFLGETGLAQPVRGWTYTIVALFVAAVVIAVGVWGQYTRRERVQGYVTSASGAATVQATEAAIVSKIDVREGDAVVAGQRLAVLTIDRAGANDEAANEALLAQLDERRRSLAQQRTETEQLGRQQVEQARRRVVSLEAEAAQLDEEIRLQTERLATANRTLAKWRELQTKDFASEYKVLEYEKAAKDEEIKLQALRRQRAGQDSGLAAARADVPSAVLRASAQVQQADQQLSIVKQEIESRILEREQFVKRVMAVTAPIDGIVTNINPANGQTVAAGTPLATILPRDATLHAEMLVPTRAIGFVKPGQPVTLRYEAFPYERFGQYRGHVESVGRDVWTQGQVGPLPVHEPVYRIVVALDDQAVRANGAMLPLRAGMLTSADLLMERRTLVEWLFQPVIQLRERMRNIDPATAGKSS